MGHCIALNTKSFRWRQIFSRNFEDKQYTQWLEDQLNPIMQHELHYTCKVLLNYATHLYWGEGVGLIYDQFCFTQMRALEAERKSIS